MTSDSSVPVDDAGGAEVEAALPEYGPAHDPWILQCAATLLSGLADRQSQGGYLVTDVHLSTSGRSIDVSVTFDGSGPAHTTNTDVTFRLNTDNLRRLFPDAQQAAAAYVYDLHLVPAVALSGAPGGKTEIHVV